MGRPPIHPTGAMTDPERAARKRQKRVEQGRRMVTVALPPKAIAALEYLKDCKFADNATEAISRALQATAARIRRRAARSLEG